MDKNFEIDKSYLVKDIRYNTGLSELQVNYITDKAINVTWKRGDGTIHHEWIELKEFLRHYEMFEELHRSIQPFDKNEIKHVKLEKFNANNFINDLFGPCPVCNGEGEIPDDRVSSGKSKCPKCFGTGQTFKTE